MKTKLHTFTLLSLLTIFLVTACSQTSKKQEVTQEDKDVYTFEIEQVTENPDANTVTIQGTITNNSTEVLKYVSMSCYWQGLFVSSNYNFKIPESTCTGDSPMIGEIAPNQHKTQNFIFSAKDGKLAGNVKIGFHLIKHIANTNAKEAYNKNIKKDDNILWSNSIAIK